MNAPVSTVDSDAPRWCDLSFPPRDAVPCRHADESIIASITNGDLELITVGLMMIGESGPFGMYIALRPAEARSIAAGLLQKADEIDGGKGTQ